MANQQQRRALTEERRLHNQRVDQLRAEGGRDRDINAEFTDHLRRTAAILGEDGEQPIVGSGGRTA